MTAHAAACPCCAAIRRQRAEAARIGNRLRRQPCAKCGSVAQRNRRRMEQRRWVWYCPVCAPPRRPRGNPGRSAPR